jgi:acetyl esterase/lipase
MAANPRTVAHSYEVDVEDVEYLRHGNKPLLARIYKPRGQGPFPAMAELHGGAWCMQDRLRDVAIHEPVARGGVVIAALDFRMPPDASYPGSIADSNYGIRWLKANAAKFNTRPDWVGVGGNSSGGHIAMLLGMRPHDPRYSAIPLPAGSPTVDATVRFVVMCAPVIDPLGRYQYAKELKAKGKPYPEFVDTVLGPHESYWITEEAMAEGSPVRALERGEKGELPEAIYIQGEHDIVHPRSNLDRFVAAYRKAGGHVQLELFDGVGAGFITANPPLPASLRAVEKIIEFIHEQAH